MADSAGLRWFTTGTVGLTANSATVTGSNTGWSTAGIKPGDIFTIDAKTIYEVASVNSNTSITLDRVFDGTTASGAHYYIIRNFAATTPAELAAAIAELVRKYENYIDTDLAQIKGEKADFSEQYRGAWASGRIYKELDVVLLDNVFYMTHSNHTSSSSNKPGASESLWVTISAELPMNIITGIQTELTSTTKKATDAEIFAAPFIASTSSSVMDAQKEYYLKLWQRAMQVRGKNLGDHFTKAQNDSIYWWINQKGTNFNDIYLGDYWESEMTYTIPEDSTIKQAGQTITRPIRFRIVQIGFNNSTNANTIQTLIVRAEYPLFEAPMNILDEKPSTGWTTGGYWNSTMRTKVMPVADAIFNQFFGNHGDDLTSFIRDDVQYWKYACMACNTYGGTTGTFTPGVGFTDAFMNGYNVVDYGSINGNFLNAPRTEWNNLTGWIPSLAQMTGKQGWRGLKTVPDNSTIGYEQFGLYRQIPYRAQFDSLVYGSYIGQNPAYPDIANVWTCDAVSEDQFLIYKNAGHMGYAIPKAANEYGAVCPCWHLRGISPDVWED